MSFKRHISFQLSQWQHKVNRKPLILRGARQVGKTTLIKDFSKGYNNSILLNLEKEKDATFFESYNDVNTIKDALFLEYNISNNELNSTLLFIDEIQESPKAIQMLRYFYEELPELHVIAAGSLLEFAMKDIKSFPVGRIEYLYLYPLNFLEFLGAIKQEQALSKVKEIPIPEFAHTTLLDLFHTYAIIGGMPEIIKTYRIAKSLVDLGTVYESIWATYKDDVKKYASNKTEQNVINHIMDVAHLYLDQRVKFQNFGNSNYRSREVGEAFRTLNDAKVIQIIYPTSDTEIPVKPSIRKSPRLQFLDTGLVNHDLKIQAQLLGLSDLNSAFKGAIIPHLIAQELISLNTNTDEKPFFWVREKSDRSSEVDLLYTHNSFVIPIEIKSGPSGKLKSLHEFVERTPHNYAVRIYAGKFSVEEHKTPNKKKAYWLMNMPYYLGTKIPDYVSYLVENY